MMSLKFGFATALLFLGSSLAFAETIKIGLNYDKTGTYSVQGLDQFQAANMAAEEINLAGGILGKQIDLVYADSQANASLSADNVKKMIEKDGIKMVFGGTASSVAIAVGKVANAAKIPFFGTLTYSTETTGEQGQKYVFRECYDSYAGANVLKDYLSAMKGKKFFYITARYTWGYTTEEQIRRISGTGDINTHKRVYTPFPNATPQDFKDAVKAAIEAKPDVLVLVVFGQDMAAALKEAYVQGLKKKVAAVVVPNITLGMAESAGPEAMEGVVGAIPWMYQLPTLKNYPRGKQFVDKFVLRYNRYPDTSGASAYTILYEYKTAVERAKSFDGPKVIAALEGHEYTSLKDKQYWRSFDHQSIQTVYAVKVKSAAHIKASKFQQDYFDIIGSMSGEQAFIPKEEWEANRKKANKPTVLD
jgi:ABC-type branched-subunit amino acid transport system substrate-binding protein